MPKKSSQNRQQPQQKTSQQPDITVNPQGEGTYKVIDTVGNVLAVPYSNVQNAVGMGYHLLPFEDRRYGRDYRADPHPVTPDIAENPKGEGTYKVTDPYGRDINIPYSNVGDALYKGYKIGAAEHSRYVDDLRADPHPVAPGEALPVRNAPVAASPSIAAQNSQGKTWRPAKTQAEYKQQQQEFEQEAGKSANARGIAQAQMPVQAPVAHASIPVSTQISNALGGMALSPLAFAVNPRETFLGMLRAGDNGANELARGSSEGGFSGWNIPNAFVAAAGGNPEAAREEWARGNYGRAVTQYGTVPALSLASSFIGPGAGEGVEAVSPGVQRAGEFLQDTVAPKAMGWALNAGKDIHLNGAEPGVAALGEGPRTSFAMTKGQLADQLNAAATRDAEIASQAASNSEAKIPSSTVQEAIDNVINPKIAGLQKQFGITDEANSLRNLRSEFDPYLSGQEAMSAADVHGMLNNLNDYIFKNREIDPATNSVISATHDIHNNIAEQLYNADPSLEAPLLQARNSLVASKLAKEIPGSSLDGAKEIAETIAKNAFQELRSPATWSNPHLAGSKLLHGVPEELWNNTIKSTPVRTGIANSLNGLGAGLSEGVVNTGITGAVRTFPSFLGVGNTSSDMVTHHGDSGVDPLVDSGTNPGINSVIKPGLNLGIKSGIDLGVQPGIQPGIDAFVNPSIGSRLNMRMNPLRENDIGQFPNQSANQPVEQDQNGKSALSDRNYNQYGSQYSKENVPHEVLHPHPQPPSAASWPQNLTPRSISPNTMGLAAQSSDPTNPVNNPFSPYLRSLNTGYGSAPERGSNYFSMPQPSVGDNDQRFQGPPITLKSLAPAAFPSSGTPRTNLYGWTEYQRGANVSDVH
ncbi:hypothetical protein [Granulicella mallensis]|uniref:Uncharacterized protein n=1 Tax=Granulicella mallensis (strain ATCC BAA-1857 / DSM 23137 / MP5ACTX8) TaxID=682795 RepID=G8NQQ1_GRAMM|nr:hypothetical protein [Granulicella mallensis]AEU37277.1 hypothetical protein AciX8_2974 [Granulicella mallensis MP5ACTX8]